MRNFIWKNGLQFRNLLWISVIIVFGLIERWLSRNACTWTPDVTDSYRVFMSLLKPLKDKYPNFEVDSKCILMVFPYLLLCSYILVNEIDCSAIVNDRLSALELALTPDMGHDGWANVVTLSNIHGCSLFTSHFHLYKNTNASMETP